MNIVLLPTNELLNNLTEIHNFIFKNCITDISNTLKCKEIFCDIFSDDAVSFDKKDIDTTHQNYNFIKDYKDNIKIDDEILKSMNDIKIFKIYIPIKEKNNYIGSFYVNITESKNNQNSLTIIHSSNNFN